jgi:hypothetical protein
MDRFWELLGRADALIGVITLYWDMFFRRMDRNGNKSQKADAYPCPCYRRICPDIRTERHGQDKG